MDTDNLDVAATHKAIIASLVRTTRAAALLVPDNVILHKAQDPQFASDLGIASSELLQVANAVLKFLAGPESRARPFAHAADVAENWSSAVEVMEQALDKADMALDQFYNRNAGSESESAATAAGTVRVAGSSGSTVRVMTSASIPCPQQAFPRGEVDNDARTPWVPKIKSKPHARVPLVAPVVGPETPVDTAFPHPYAYELEHLEWPDHLFEVPAPQEHQGSDETGAVGVRPGPLESTPYEFVDTLPALQRMLAEMRGAHEVAVDLEHHNYRTYLGLTCLMQVSTRTHDWIVDTLALRMHCHLLNEVFADPEVVKVLHGAESDVIWLQRDLGLYLVNLFDTFHATRALAFPRNSLAYLLKRYCDVNANKQYQLADWRMRPLPADMERYAREDTHYLLYIYDQLRAELAANSPQQQPPLGSSSSTKTRAQLIEVVLRKSVTTASQVFTKERYDAETGSGALGWFNMMLKNPRPMTRRASAALKALHAWRDALAREEDESVHYVTPNHALFALAEKMPQDPQAVVAHVHPSPPMLKLHAGEVARILKGVAAAFANDPDAGRIASPVRMPDPTHVRFDEDGNPVGGVDAVTAAAASDVAADTGLGVEAALPYVPYERKHSPVQVVAVHRSALFPDLHLQSVASVSASRIETANLVHQIKANMDQVEALQPRVLTGSASSPAQDDESSMGAVDDVPASPLKTNGQMDLGKDAIIVANPRARASGAAAVAAAASDMQSMTVETLKGMDEALVGASSRKRHRNAAADQAEKYDFSSRAPSAAARVVQSKDGDESDDAADAEEEGDEPRAKRSRTSNEFSFNPYAEVSEDGPKARKSSGPRRGGRGGGGRSSTFRASRTN